MLETAIEAAAEAGKLLRRNFGATQHDVNLATHHDIKLELDVQAQQTITKVILADFPDSCILGEEGVSGNQDADVRWVVDPLDGTVNYFYGIPHYAVSVAAQVRRSVNGDERVLPATVGSRETTAGGTPAPLSEGWETVAAAVLDPELDEMFVSEKGKPAMLHGHPIRVSERTEISEAILAIGFFKDAESISRSLETFKDLIQRVRKVRLMGAAALDVCYVACGRYDGFIEYGVKIWDVAAGQLILENAGGRAEISPVIVGEPHALNVRMWNGKVPLAELAAR